MFSCKQQKVINALADATKRKAEAKESKSSRDPDQKTFYCDYCGIKGHTSNVCRKLAAARKYPAYNNPLTPIFFQTPYQQLPTSYSHAQQWQPFGPLASPQLLACPPQFGAAHLHSNWQTSDGQSSNDT
jgi:hypothetical protein